MDYLRFELRKIKGSGILVIGVVLTILSVLFQGYLGLMVKEITCDIIHVTAMDLFSTLIFPIFISVVVSESFSIEETNCGIANSYFTNISINKIYTMKLLTVRLINLFYFILAAAITMIFVALKGGNPLLTLLKEWKWIVLSVLTIFSLINIVGLIIILFKSRLCSMLISVIATIFASILNPLGISWLNPWYGFEHALFYRGLSPIAITYMITLFVLSEFLIKKKIQVIPNLLESMV
ncbi:ABC transporter permease [Butyrivibrio sp. AE2005]|uniref:ABC transporter permease n=1 Tax=Butyrivibrio sp. AE2005 TaxID=1496722 RepID=UPI00047EA608|nr:ABC transporter permease [Butyrivibrio sp. AE2005]